MMRAAELPVRYNAVEVLERNLPERAGEVALVSRERPCTFAEVAADVNRVGNALRRLDVRPGERVALLLPDSAEWVAAFFGTLKVGAIALGLNTLLKPHDYAFTLTDAGARVLIVHASLFASVEGVRDALPALEHVVVVGGPVRTGDVDWTAWLAREPAELAPADTHREDPCCLNYSSGTTGEPKGILHAHQDLPLSARNWGVGVLGLRPDDRTFAAAKLFFTFGLGGNLIFPWSVGASVVLFAGSPRRAADVLDEIERFRPTILFHAPTGYASMLADEGLAERDLSSLRLCVSAGEALPAPLWHSWKRATGLDVLDGIGSTENFHIFLSNRPDDIRPGSSGKPFPGYEVKLVDDAGDDVRESGRVGHLWVKGETAALAYLHRAAESRRTFRGEWLVTGDQYARDEDGYYWHAGRSDDMLKVGGIWVSPIEVEARILTHPAVHECAVVGEADGAGLEKPKAFVVLRAGRAAADELARELIEHCRAGLAEYKRPRRIEFVSELPRTATGKVQRFRLRAEGS
jgi:benzoate-CoA ligase family protein